MKVSNYNEKVSVVVPVYNAEKSLGECLDSILSQDYQNIEIVLIDDGSTDSSAELCASYQKKYGSKIKYFYQSNSGPAAARNQGIEKSSGKYIAFVDADDTVSPVMISTMVSKAEEHHTDMVVCAYWLVEDGQTSECFYDLPEGLYQENQTKKVLFSVLEEGDHSIPPYSWVRLTRKSVFSDHNLQFQNGLIRSEDFHFWTKVHAQIERVYLLSSTPLYYYVQNRQSITHRYVKGYWDGVQFIYDDLKKTLSDTQVIRDQLSMMLVRRSLISLNNAARCTSLRRAWSDIWAIVTNKRLNREIKYLNQIDAKKMKSYRKLMGNHGQLFVAMKYMFECIRFNIKER